MSETRGERRAETAKLNDDSGLIDAAEKEAAEGAGQQGSAGGNLQRDIGTQAEKARTTEPEAHESVNKGDHMAHGQHTDEPHPAEHVVTERD
jgi:hypothetical protein